MMSRLVCFIIIIVIVIITIIIVVLIIIHLSCIHDFVTSTSWSAERSSQSSRKIYFARSNPRYKLFMEEIKVSIDFYLQKRED